MAGLSGRADMKDIQMQEQKRQIGTLEDGLFDYEATISQFRELVLSLQGSVIAGVQLLY